MKRCQLKDEIDSTAKEIQFRIFCRAQTIIFDELISYYLAFPACGALQSYEAPELEEDGLIWIAFQTNNYGIVDHGYWAPDSWMLAKFQDLALETETSFIGFEVTDSDWVMAFFQIEEANLFDSLHKNR